MTFLVGLAGPKGVGKTTTANKLYRLLDEKLFVSLGTYTRIGVMSFAAPLYIIVAEITNKSPQWLKENKNHVWEETDKFLSGWTPRSLLQYVGTDLLRDNLSKNIWVDIAVSAAEQSVLDIVIFDDCRFSNEVEHLDLTIELQRSDVEYTGEHMSEMGGLPVTKQHKIDTEQDIIDLADYIVKEYYKCNS